MQEKDMQRRSLGASLGEATSMKIAVEESKRSNVAVECEILDKVSYWRELDEKNLF